MPGIRPLILSTVIAGLAVAGLAFAGPTQTAQAGIFEDHCRVKHYDKDHHWLHDKKIDCGPVYWKWRLPVGNGHDWYPHPCIGPASMYSPPLPSYYRGPYLRTIDIPLE
jgi:hypothetical protein